MWGGEIGAYMISTPQRDDVRRDTLADFAATDWGAPPIVLFDDHPSDRPQTRVEALTRTTVERALDDRAEVFLIFEDDLAFNTSLRFNLEHWPPLVDRMVGTPFFASLYDPGIGSLAQGAHGRTHRVVDPDLTYGSQALMMSATTAVWILHHWTDVIGMPDIKMPRLAAQLAPIYYHRPSLVQHRPVPSLWGGVPHHAADFASDWRAS